MDTTKQLIITFLEQNFRDEYCWGGQLARAIHEINGTKESVVERRARELVNENVLEKTYAQVEGEGPRCVRYRLKPTLEDKAAILLENSYDKVIDEAQTTLF